MTPTRKILCVLVAIVAGASILYASGFQLNEHGARAMAQAGAFAARATDGSAIYFNPAGLAFQNEGAIYLGATMIIPNNSFYGPSQLNTNAKSEMVKQTFFPFNGYISYPVTEKLVAGFGVNNPFGLGTEWPSNWAGKDLNIKSDLKSFFFTPTLAYKVDEKFSVGAGFMYVTGSVKIQKAVPSPIDDPHVTLDMSGHGMGFTIGMLYKFLPEFSLGVSYRSEVKIDASGTASFDPNYSLLPGGDASSSLTLPPVAFVGLAYKPMTNLEVEADYQFTGWSTYRELRIDFAKDGSNSTTPKDYQDSYILRIGGEYTMAPFHFRAGYLYDHSPVQTAYVDPILPDASRNGINVGLGYDITSKISVDAAYFFLKFDQRNVTNSIPETNFDGTYNAYANLMALNLEYKF